MTEKMKPSGITWIGDIPENWKVKKLRFILDENGIKVGPFGSSISSGDYCDEGKWVYNQRTVLDDEFSIADACISEEKYREMIGFKVNAGDMLITSRGTIGKVAIVPEGAPEGILHPCIIKFSIDKEQVVDRLLKKIFNETDFIREQLGYLSNATTIEVIYSYTLKDIYLPIAPINEQRAIADFLDIQCTKIDSVIADIEKQIETLQKYKKSLITETVTKGLNRSVPMKDSGIDWIGDIPMHWDIHRIKDTCSLARGGSPRPINEYLSDNPNDLNWIRISDTVKGSKYIIQTEQKIIKSGLSNSRLVHEGDLLLTNSMSFGQPYILKITGCIHDGWLVFSDYRGIDKLFLYYALMSELCYIQFKTSVAGAVVENLSIDKVGISKIFVPPIEEQERIVKYLDAKCVIIDEILLKKEEQLETMKQHKKSLIYEYVTGKKRVTEVN